MGSRTFFGGREGVDVVGGTSKASNILEIVFSFY